MSMALMLKMDGGDKGDTYSPFAGFAMLISMDSWAMDTERVIGAWLDDESRDDVKDTELFGKDALDSIKRIRAELKNLKRILTEDAIPSFVSEMIVDTEE